jgi:hypothetical protein
MAGQPENASTNPRWRHESGTFGGKVNAILKALPAGQPADTRRIPGVSCWETDPKATLEALRILTSTPLIVTVGRRNRVMRISTS